MNNHYNEKNMKAFSGKRGIKEVITIRLVMHTDAWREHYDKYFSEGNEKKTLTLKNQSLLIAVRQLYDKSSELSIGKTTNLT